MLFLADIPDQVQLLTIDGRFKMGFRNPNTGEEASFTVVDPKTGKPYVRLIGPSDGGTGNGTLTGSGYLVVDIPAGPAGSVLRADTVTDLAPEFKFAAGSTFRLDNSQAPVQVDGKFWYWIKGDAGATGNVSIIWLKETWSYTGADGQDAFYAGGAFQDADNVWQGEAASTVSVPAFMIPYLDVRLVPSATGEINDAALQSFATSGVVLTRKEQAGDVTLSQVTPTTNVKSWISLGGGKVRFFYAPGTVAAPTFKDGVYVLTVAPSTAWQDSAVRRATQQDLLLHARQPDGDVISPVSATARRWTHVAAHAPATPTRCVFKATPGASLITRRSSMRARNSPWAVRG